METISSDAAELKEKAVQSREGADEAIQSITDVEQLLPQAADDARLLLKNVAEGRRDIALAYESGKTYQCFREEESYSLWIFFTKTVGGILEHLEGEKVVCIKGFVITFTIVNSHYVDIRFIRWYLFPL